MRGSDSAELSIQAGSDGFIICIHTGSNKLIRAFRYYKFHDSFTEEGILQKISEILHKDELLRIRYKTVKVIYTGRKSTPVPTEYFREEHLKKILEFNHPLDELDEIHHNLIAGCDSDLVFAIPTYFAGLISDKFKNITFYNQAFPLLNYALNNNHDSNTELVYIQLNKDFFDMVVIKEGKLNLYNSFLYVNPVDLLYFILYACKQLKIDTAKTKFLLSGERSLEGDIINEIEKYIQHLQPITKTTILPVAEKLKPSEQQQFFGLINLNSCE